MPELTARQVGDLGSALATMAARVEEVSHRGEPFISLEEFKAALREASEYLLAQERAMTRAGGSASRAEMPLPSVEALQQIVEHAYKAALETGNMRWPYLTAVAIRSALSQQVQNTKEGSTC